MSKDKIVELSVVKGERIRDEGNPDEGHRSTTANDVLEYSKDRYSEVIVVGYDKDGNLNVSSTNMSYARINWALDVLKNALVNGSAGSLNKEGE